MRRHKKPLIKQPVTVSIGADFVTDRGRGKPPADQIDIFFSAYDITARRRQPSAGIFDQRPHRDIRAYVAGFFFLHKFPVAVIDENTACKAQRTYICADIPELGNCKRVAKLVPARTLNINHFQALTELFHVFFNLRAVEFSVLRQISLFKSDTEIFQRTVSLAENHAANGIVRHSGDGQHGVAGRKTPNSATVKACVPESSAGETIPASAPKEQANTSPSTNRPSSPYP